MSIDTTALLVEREALVIERDALAEIIKSLRDQCAIEHESKDSFISRIRLTLGDTNPVSRVRQELAESNASIRQLTGMIEQEQKRLDWALNNSAYYGIGVLTYVDESGKVEDRVVPRGQVRQVIDVLIGNEAEVGHG